MQTVQKTLTQYGLRSQSKRSAYEEMEENMAATPTLETRKDAIMELASIKILLQGIVSDLSRLKSGMDAVQSGKASLFVEHNSYTRQFKLLYSYIKSQEGE